jgi:hypothetical protein
MTIGFITCLTDGNELLFEDECDTRIVQFTRIEPLTMKGLQKTEAVGPTLLPTSRHAISVILF